MFGECICIKDYLVFKKGEKYKYEIGRYTLIFNVEGSKVTISEFDFYNYFTDC